MKTYIFDVDGTIANTDHRNHFLDGKKDWTGWHKAAMSDTPYWEIVDLMELAHAAGIKVVICTGRDNSQRESTVQWLTEHNITCYDRLFMRPEKDRRDDTVVKFEMLEQILEEGYKPVLVFEDRDRVVNMWRDAGLKCLQVKPGDY